MGAAGTNRPKYFQDQCDGDKNSPCMWIVLYGLSIAFTFVNSFGSHGMMQNWQGRLSLFIDKEMEAQRSEMNISRTYS